MALRYQGGLHWARPCWRFELLERQAIGTGENLFSPSKSIKTEVKLFQTAHAMMKDLTSKQVPGGHAKNSWVSDSFSLPPGHISLFAGEDRTTAALQKLLRLPSIASLRAAEQFRFCVLAGWLRSAEHLWCMKACQFF